MKKSLSLLLAASFCSPLPFLAARDIRKKPEVKSATALGTQSAIFATAGATALIIGLLYLTNKEQQRLQQAAQVQRTNPPQIGQQIESRIGDDESKHITDQATGYQITNTNEKDVSEQIKQDEEQQITQTSAKNLTKEGIAKSGNQLLLNQMIAQGLSGEEKTIINELAAGNRYNPTLKVNNPPKEINVEGIAHYIEKTDNYFRSKIGNRQTISIDEFNQWFNESDANYMTEFPIVASLQDMHLPKFARQNKVMLRWTS